MGLLGTITPEEAEAGRILSMVTMVVVLGVGLVPPLRPYVRRIQVTMAASYILCLVGFVVYRVLFD